MDDTPPPEEFDHEGTLCYVLDGDEVLLIWKKRGIGAQQYNAPGGKIEPGDASPRAAAKREVREEVRIEVDDLEKAGELAFFFGDTPFMYGYVYRTSRYEGVPEETAEARPEWVAIDEIPYDRMWADDRHWVPLMLEGNRVAGRFRFDADGDELLDWDVEATDG